ncbi:Tripartite tricarboxylate transporter family receptor [Pigmentiphaga humi]|uniref:Tripartite tricarboxylate transporter family receptor n=1 Tax=Pigmentiphaga humi TaxID=2478468 RepID=A0A3P4AZ05_9BURK|nr:tripartite tricarboxylate transporter substrate-binding protein [Pigmentiphaga humi]VCU68811.1 Tripartite tricarboxylate transporter family receptor [Pigmentiphaga humi]
MNFRFRSAATPFMLRAAAIAAFALACGSQAVHAANYPAKPVKIIVPQTPGTVSDLFARALAKDLAARLGQPFIVENKTGAGTAIGSSYVAKSAPDGYTVLVTMNSHFQSPAINKVSYDPVADFTPVTMMLEGPLVAVAHPSIPANNFAEFIDYVKKQGDHATYGSPGVGTATHLHSVIIQDLIGSKMRHIPAAGFGAALMDVMQNSTTMILSGVENAQPLQKSGKAKLLAVTGSERIDVLPEVGSLAEAGVHSPVDLSIYVAMFAPAGTPKPIVDLLYKTTSESMKTPEMLAWMHERGYRGMLPTPEEFAKIGRNEFEFWKKAVAQHGLRVND